MVSPSSQPFEPAVPNLYIVGVPKAGTTSLARSLEASGQVSFGVAKEAGLLSNDSYSTEQLIHLYAKHFGASAGSYRADGTPYLFYLADRVG